MHNCHIQTVNLMENLVERLAEVAFTLMTLNDYYRSLYQKTYDITDPVTAATVLVNFNESDDILSEELVKAYACLKVIQHSEADSASSLEDVPYLDISAGAELIDSNPMAEEGLLEW